MHDGSPAPGIAGVSRRKMLFGTVAGVGAAAVGLTLGTGSAEAASLKNGLWCNPAQGYFPSGGHFGADRGSVSHAGQDITGPSGTAIYAARGGTVYAAGWNVLSGRTGYGIILSHGSGSYTYYGHLSKLYVSKGESVGAGAWIALMGTTGNSTGPHLHFEVHSGGLHSITDPVPFMRNRGIDLGGGWSTLDPGASGESVKIIQRLLRSRNIADLRIDGDYGSVTTSAVKKLQQNKGLVTDGQVGPVTWPNLIRSVNANAGSEQVKAAQVALNKHSHGLLVDGDYGPVTEQAIEKFQSVNQLYVDGLCGPKTWRVLVA
ncbi:hypothetical protein GCM10009676_06210 [Prauserella halophila]|uniref:Peptidoglycan binding protein n=1 Tax=Prauserella halophila TaxID=185641 RepID=A0ABN1VY84_9PSEU|nr:peptidoglycan-binding protein [Prauserella halophila]MCP2237329.1 putative peptidoglycan binding domain-containing protein [Prauserella halophila]